MNSGRPLWIVCREGRHFKLPIGAESTRTPPLRLTRATGYSASRLTRAVKTVGSRVAAGTIRDRTAG